MTAPNAAVGALPGWRGTDPHGGTWVRLTRRSGHPWLEITATGGLHFRTQEAAEAAGLVRLIPAVGYHYDERGEDVVPDAVFGLTDAEVPTAADSFVRCTEEGPNGQCDQDARLGHFCSRKGHPIDSVETSAGERYTPAIAPAAPAPLDPGNPDVRAVVEALQVLERRWPDHGILRNARTFLAAEADRLDREHAEAEQDASDRAEADNYAKESSTTEEFWARHNAYLDGIRAERARQEAGQ